MLRTILNRLLAHPWWLVLAATAAAALAWDIWVGLIVFVLTGGAAVTARNLAAQDSKSAAVGPTGALGAEQAESLWGEQQPLGMRDPYDLFDRMKYGPEYANLPGNIWHHP